MEILPDFLKSASMTAEWENQLLLMEHGEIAPEQFYDRDQKHADHDAEWMRCDFRRRNKKISDQRKHWTCPVCGSLVYESKTNFYCSNHDCHFALWKDNRYLQSMEKTMDKKRWLQNF